MCAVELCNERARRQFDKLFFVNFPICTKSLCESWWRLCGRTDSFDPSYKICSIHFATGDFAMVMERRDGHIYRQTILKNTKIVPTLFLKADDYIEFSRKRNKSSSGDDSEYLYIFTS